MFGHASSATMSATTFPPARLVTTVRSRRGTRLGRGARTVAIAACAVAVLFGALQWTRHEVWAAPRVVVSGQLVRSGQLDVDELARVVEQYGIRRVIGLRKFDPPAAEYAIEMEWLAEHGVEHVNVALSPTRLPKPEALNALLDAMHAGPRPVLLHCEEGVDRTGLATVLWLVIEEHQDLADARRRELSWRNGHVAVGQAHAMDDFLDLYQRTSGGRDLAAWIVADYPRLWSEATGRPLPEEPRVLVHDPR